MAKERVFSDEQRARAEEFVRDCFHIMKMKQTEELVQSVTTKVLKTLPNNAR